MKRLKNYQKVYSDNTLKSLTKSELIEIIRIYEHNIDVLCDTEIVLKKTLIRCSCKLDEFIDLVRFINHEIN